jgi:hypothetical protein
VFMAAMIMLNACSPPHLLAYASHIAQYARRYGQQCWALIYQVETRFRREFMERARRRASNELDDSIVNGTAHAFNPSRPWDFVFKKSAGESLDSSAARYWHLNLEEPCLLIVAGARRVDGFLDGDASVCASGSSHMATQGTPIFSLLDRETGASGSRQPAERKTSAHAPPAKRKDAPSRSSGGVKPGAIMVDGKYTTNRQGNPLCMLFNSGACSGPRGANVTCPKDPTRRHNCHKCLSADHGANTCTGAAPAGNTRGFNGKKQKKR